LVYPDAIGLKYWRSIEPMIKAMHRETEAEMVALFDKPKIEKAMETMDATIAEQAQAIIARLIKKYLRIFERDSDFIVRKFVNDASKVSAHNLTGSINSMATTLNISSEFLITGNMAEQFSAITEANVALFKTIPAQYFPRVEIAVMESITKGKGLADLKPFFQNFSNGELNYAKNRALDQTRKAYTGINMARMKRLGIKKVKWLHSHGSNAPRKLHQEMNGKIYDLDNPPFIGVMYGQDIYGWGGELPNCRCTCSPVFEIDGEFI